MRSIVKLTAILAVLGGLYQFGPFRDQVDSLGGSARDGLGAMTGKTAVDAGQHAKRVLQQKTFDRAVDQYERLRGEAPKSLEDLADEGLLQKAQLLDEWGRDLKLEASLDGLMLRSAGPDGHYETDDDWVFSP